MDVQVRGVVRGVDEVRHELIRLLRRQMACPGEERGKCVQYGPLACVAADEGAEEPGGDVRRLLTLLVMASCREVEVLAVPARDAHALGPVEGLGDTLRVLREFGEGDRWCGHPRPYFGTYSEVERGFSE
ncbi:hypothetical protein ACPCKW_32035 [Streptomyces griseoincarnatus]